MPRVEEALRYSPDVLVLAFGHNLGFRYPTDSWQLRMFQLASFSRFLGLAIPSPDSGDRDHDLNRRIGIYRDWLNRLVRPDLRGSSRIILVTVVANSWVPTADAVACREDEELLDAQLDWYGGQRESAIEKLKAMVRGGEDRCPAYLLATWLARVGRPAEAGRYLSMLPAGPQWASNRASPEVNELLRAVPDGDQVLLYDLEQRVADRSPGGIPSWGQMRDHCHVLNSLLVTESTGILRLAARMAGTPLAEPTRPLEEYSAPATVFEPLEGLVRTLGPLDPEDGRHWLAAIPRVVEEWAARGDGFTDVDFRSFVDVNLVRLEEDPRRRALVLVELAEGLWHANRSDEALAVNARARREGVAEAWVQLAWFRLADDPASAAAAAARAREIDPGSAAASFLVRRLASASGAVEPARP
jgi:hypothetical protein